jgi:hypothetical protein
MGENLTLELVALMAWWPGGPDKCPPPNNVFRAADRAAVVQGIISLASLNLRTMSRLPSLLQTRPGSFESPET